MPIPILIPKTDMKLPMSRVTRVYVVCQSYATSTYDDCFRSQTVKCQDISINKHKFKVTRRTADLHVVVDDRDHDKTLIFITKEFPSGG